MTAHDDLVQAAEAELRAARITTASANWDDASRTALWAAFRRWMAHPQFGQGSGMLEAAVLSELQFTLGDLQLRDDG